VGEKKNLQPAFPDRKIWSQTMSKTWDWCGESSKEGEDLGDTAIKQPQRGSDEIDICATRFNQEEESRTSEKKGQLPDLTTLLDIRNSLAAFTSNPTLYHARGWSTKEKKEMTGPDKEKSPPLWRLSGKGSPI